MNSKLVFIYWRAFYTGCILKCGEAHPDESLGGAIMIFTPGAVETAEIPQSQRTLGRPVHFAGIGLHSGTEAEIVIDPAPEDYGIRFSRNGSQCAAVIPEFICAGDSTTTAIFNGSSLRCVEHVMSCLHALQIANAHIVVLYGDETPILDASAALFASRMSEAGIVPQSRLARGLFIRREISLRDETGLREIRAYPSNGFSVVARIEFPPPIGVQTYSCEINELSFSNDIADARTFLQTSIDAVPLEVLKAGRLRGLQGPRPQLCQPIVYDDRGYLSQLRHPDEPVRHKILDFIGDIYTTGTFVRGHFDLHRPGHEFSLRFAELLKAHT